MIKGEAKIVETDVVIFPMQFGQGSQKIILSAESENKPEIKEKPIQNNTGDRFARLKKSVRKKSAGIL